MPRGIFVSFEGSEGCGKSTQIRLLADRLKALGHQVILTREPGGTEIGEQLRHLLQFSKAGHAMASETELLLFAASRAQLVREVIAPALEAGAIVLADRFLDSTTVYQGVARKLDPAEVAAINRFAVGDTLPDITFVFDLDLAIARERMRHRPAPAGAPDRMESQPAAFFEAVRAGYLALARENTTRVRLLDAAGTVEDLSNRIWQELAPRLSPLPVTK
ncbi:dTMP kinase [Chthoniobacter flavus Ellin428]|uniref:Thymidylate kinase n=1 Tax=Chthoniobacter flavus Ellin428 TaxID=497964 RepID=B4DAI4_9BACT|nr:dTMP kinase [Chthoniobacter flavus]EDY16502.1 dTMP kinase [Chthoniobacter flavus Ellin428]TCO85238.1 dTMP kinase [Chthoniobacter flavus]